LFFQVNIPSSVVILVPHCQKGKGPEKERGGRREGAGEKKGLEKGRGQRKVGWYALENGSRWRMGVAREQKPLENGRRWRMGGAGEWQALEKSSGQRNLVAGET
jgi:hypothetical protein